MPNEKAVLNQAKKEESLLRQALEDLEAEIVRLADKKKIIEDSVDKFKKQLGDTRKEEAKLKEELDSIVDRETELDEKRVKKEEELRQIREKIIKITKLGEQLREI